jgi:hypothetical protein
MAKFENVATPFTAFCVSVPARTPPGPALFAMAMVTALFAVVTTFPDESSTLTCTAGVIEAPTATLVGCTVNATFAGPAAVTLNAVLVALVNPVAVAISV